MTVFEYAVFREAVKLMTEDEVLLAEKLAAKADSGSQDALTDMRRLTSLVILDRTRHSGAKGNKVAA